MNIDTTPDRIDAVHVDFGRITRIRYKPEYLERVEAMEPAQRAIEEAKIRAEQAEALANRRELSGEADDPDPEPYPRFVPEWEAWLEQKAAGAQGPAPQIDRYTSEWKAWNERRKATAQTAQRIAVDAKYGEMTLLRRIRNIFTGELGY